MKSYKLKTLADFFIFIADIDKMIHYDNRIENGHLGNRARDARELIIAAVITDFANEIEYADKMLGDDFTLVGCYVPLVGQDWEVNDIYVSASNSKGKQDEVSDRELYEIRVVNKNTGRLRLAISKPKS